jgi:undecaprenyl diphosphate synthase
MKTNIPKCIGIIMDGNRRWAREKGLSTVAGHEAGYKKLQEVVNWAHELGVKNLIFYAFSSENWNRSPKEVSYIMNLVENALGDYFEKLKEKNIRIRFAGDKKRLPEKLCLKMEEVEKKTSENNDGTVVACISYGGRQEIVSAVNKVIENKNAEITEEAIGSNLDTYGIPDPDIIIRPGGERRLSNFLTWQSIYSEFFFIPTYWPDFSREEFEKIIKEYSERERRFGQ